MASLVPWFEANPILYGIAFFLSVCLFLMVVLTIMFRRAGRSLRPIVFFLAFLAIIAGPQGVGHLLMLKAPGTLDAPSAPGYLPDASAFAVADGRFANPQRVFGDSVDLDLIQNAVPIFPEMLAKAQAAELAFAQSGEMTLAAIFPDEASAQGAHDSFGTIMQFRDAEGSDAAGWFATRGTAGDRVFLLRSGAIVMAWTGADDEAIAARRDALFSPVAGAEPVAAVSPPVPFAKPILEFFSDVRIQIAGVLLNLIAAVAWFFVMSTWAVQKGPTPGAPRASLAELMERLRAINGTGAPFDVLPSDDPKRIEATWRVADARWISMASVHGIRRTHKLRLLLDEGSRTVRVREYWAAYDWSARHDAFSLNWKAATGMMFFEYEKQRVYGIQLGPDGKPTGELSFEYTFNLDEMKQPLIDVVTRAGWTWRPVMLALRK